MNESKVISPHLGIYKPQITSVLSIMHRLSGVFLYFGIILLPFLFIPLMQRDEFSNNAFDYVLVAYVILLEYAFFYHLLNGIRHLFWDAKKGLEIKDVKMSGILVLFFSFILSMIPIAIYCYNK